MPKRSFFDLRDFRKRQSISRETCGSTRKRQSISRETCGSNRKRQSISRGTCGSIRKHQSISRETCGSTRKRQGKRRETCGSTRKRQSISRGTCGTSAGQKHFGRLQRAIKDILLGLGSLFFHRTHVVYEITHFLLAIACKMRLKCHRQSEMGFSGLIPYVCP